VEIWPLANAFARAASDDPSRPTPVFSFEAREALMTYSWPGNIRELRNTIEAATLLACNGVIQLDDLQLPSPTETPSEDFTPAPLIPEAGLHLPGGGPPPVRNRRYPTREEILAALACCGGNQTLAAARVGIGRRTLCRVLVRMGIPRPRRSGPSPEDRPTSVSRSDLDPRFRQ
jgi:DNA-binding NtrC family response regulator